MNGYVYLRNHASYVDIHNEPLYKMGKTNNIPERDDQYATSEVFRGKFVCVFQVENESYIERLLQNEFNSFNKRYDGGIEFYDKKIIDYIEPFLITKGIKYKKLTEEEIDNLTRRKKDAEQEDKENLISFVPREDQSIIINNSVKYFEQNDKGMLILPCGMGKTLISLWIAKGLGMKTILIGVPSLPILNQWSEIISHLFSSVPCLVVSGEDTSDDAKITDFLKRNSKECIVITTYSSSYKIRKTLFQFDMKIYDEVHHLTTPNLNIDKESKKYVEILKILSKKQLSLTATLKQLEDMGEEKEIVSNNDVNYFGEVIERRCLLWAIKRGIVCDYVIQTIITQKEQLEGQLKQLNIKDIVNTRLFLSAYATLKSITEGHSHHCLIYTNSKENARKINEYINILIQNKIFDVNLYNSSYHSEMNKKSRDVILNQFNTSMYGILSCVYCLGEGYDNCIIDAVVIAENMKSIIRIFQSLLRSCRKDKHKPDKVAKIILPLLINDDEDWISENEPDFTTVREVIHLMGMEDEEISQKIKVFPMVIGSKKEKEEDDKESEEQEKEEFGFVEDEELTKKLRLKTTNRQHLNRTTYEKARTIIRNKGIKSKKDYFELCQQDNRLSKEPEKTYGGQFSSWVKYLSIEQVYYSLEICKEKVNEYLSLSPELKKYHLNLMIICIELSRRDKLFPPCDLWTEYYSVYHDKSIKELKDIITISSSLNVRKKKPGLV